MHMYDLVTTIGLSTWEYTTFIAVRSKLAVEK